MIKKVISQIPRYMGEWRAGGKYPVLARVSWSGREYENLVLDNPAAPPDPSWRLVTDSSGEAIPKSELDKKQDKIPGKTLSDHNFTTAERDILAGLGVVTSEKAGLMSPEFKKRLSDLDLMSVMEDYLSYGVVIDTTVSSPTLQRIGNPDLHRSLPIQSGMKGCLLSDDGKVLEWLPSDSWVGCTLDGSKGQVMVRIPGHYAKFTTIGTKQYVRLSTDNLPGFHYVPTIYVSAYEATIQRSMGKLCSVVNMDPDYRGGNNNAAKDGTFASQLGRPATNFNITKGREMARKRNNGDPKWNLYTYQAHKTLTWLFIVEYATLNSQAPFNPQLTADGFRQGGLGKGISDLVNWDKFGFCPPVPCGTTNSLGNRSGFVEYVCAKSDDNSLAPQTLQAISYRGIENPFGHCWELTDGAKFLIQAESAGNTSEFYVCNDKERWNINGIADYEFRYVLPRSNGFVKEIVIGEFGEIMPLKIGAGSTTYFCDYFYTNIPSSGVSERILLLGGTADMGAYPGFTCSYTRWTAADMYVAVGTRLCYLPE